MANRTPHLGSPSEPQLAYRNQDFLESEEARPLRILAEYLHPLHQFQAQSVQETVVFFGSARRHETEPFARYERDARELARLVTDWTTRTTGPENRVLVCTGAGGGIMEAANQGARDAGGRTIGLNVGLPHEQRPNAYVTPELSFQFHYFFMRKLWFAHLARAVVVFPGGFGTLDELFEMLTLTQTRKLDRTIHIVLYGPQYWNEIVNFEALVTHGMIAREDLQIFRFVDTPTEAFNLLQGWLAPVPDARCPAFARSVTPPSPRDGVRA